MLKKLDLRGFEGELDTVLPRPSLDDEAPVALVREILENVRTNGDKALIELTLKYDNVDLDSLRVPKDELYGALDMIPRDLRSALEEAREAIAGFHEHSFVVPSRYEREGITVDHLVRPVSRAGLYAPGGRAIYPSSVLMCAIPARVAGVASLVLCVPPGPNGQIPLPTLAAAALVGVDEVYSIGGAQAVAAMAYGTETIDPVDVIVGPGNKYVSIAKRLVAGVVGIPSAFAGPSEVVVIADNTIDPEWAAIDVIVQAEHGPDGLAWLISWQEEVIDSILKVMENQVKNAPRRSEIEATLANGGYAVLVDSPAQAVDVANHVAPEHLELACGDSHILVPAVQNAGAVFCGPLAPASIGDYLAGPNHVLPTFRSARFSSALGVNDFVRHSHAISITQKGLERVAPFVESIALAEGLDAHAQSVAMRVAGSKLRAEFEEEQVSKSSSGLRFKRHSG